MALYTSDLKQNIDFITSELGMKSSIVVKSFFIGSDQPLDAAIIYINGLVEKNTIDRDILSPLMLYIQENLNCKENLAEYLCKRYIFMSSTNIETDINEIITSVKKGNSVILINGIFEGIVLDTSGGESRSILEPETETSVRGSRESFVENLDTNISLIGRKLKDKNLVVEKFILGQLTQNDAAIIYVQDLADDTVVNKIRERICSINVDKVTDVGTLQQYIEDYTYSPFPQTLVTERPDVAVAQLSEGRVIMAVEGSPTVLTGPATLIEFFQAVEDYYQRTLASSFIRIIRLLAVFIVITLPSIYLTLMKFNTELIPIKFITPIIQSRIGIALTPFMEILSMELIVEFLREGGLRLPSKIGQTLSVVGGIIIGDTAVRSRIVSPTTLFIIGISVISTFLIPKYDMSIAIRLLRFPMLLLANFLGIFGIGLGYFVITVHLCSLDSFGVPYLEFKKQDMKDVFIRSPLWQFNKRPKSIPNKDSVRQSDFRDKWQKDE
ncbi:spore germination protein [Clostridium sp. A1-XYC3]|uniref:Spore germination protein n=1 Tax=Clostridium tanneri TaxID=3037988 RepID=A0ABU4JXC4_9CLOT|nr:spore germination protein [Clostridium sp. A1-XYC3]MDW8802811.1 spore germination protein [Clostridium sp. A1-XYC3]